MFPPCNHPFPEALAPSETASAVLWIFVDWEAQEEEMESLVDEVVDAGHRVDSGENYDYDGNLDC